MNHMQRALIAMSIRDPKAQVILPTEPLYARLISLVLETREDGSHHVVCPHCGAEIACDGSADAPRAYYEHRQNDCPEPLEGGKDARP